MAEVDQGRREVTDDRETLWVERVGLVIMVPLGYPLFLVAAWVIGLLPGQTSTITSNSSIDNIAFVGLAVVAVFVLGALSLSLSNTLDIPRRLRGRIGTTLLYALVAVPPAVACALFERLHHAT